MTFLIVSVGICWFLAAVCNAIMDVLAFRYGMSMFSTLPGYFWNPKDSWKNKYKDRTKSKGPKFFGSTTFLVWTTDAWHLFQMLSNSFIIISMVLIFYTAFPHIEWWINILLFIGLKITWGSVFELFFRKILLNR